MCVLTCNSLKDVQREILHAIEEQSKDLPHRTRFDVNFSSRYSRGRLKGSTINNFDRTAGLLQSRHLRELECIRDRWIIGYTTISSFRSSGRGIAKIKFKKRRRPPAILVPVTIVSQAYAQGKIYNSCSGILSNACKFPCNPKFFATTSLGTCASQSRYRGCLSLGFGLDWVCRFMKTEFV